MKYRETISQLELIAIKFVFIREIQAFEYSTGTGEPQNSNKTHDIELTHKTNAISLKIRMNSSSSTFNI